MSRLQSWGTTASKTTSCCGEKTGSSTRVLDLSSCKHSICFRCLSKICSKALNNRSPATCWNWKCSKEISLEQVGLVLSHLEFTMYLARCKEVVLTKCASCSLKKGKNELKVAPCGHFYCKACLLVMSRLALGDRALVPLRCCKKELPDDYVRDVLAGPEEYAKYQKLMLEKDWKTSDLESDAEYTATVRALGAKQCPGCGIGVQRDFGCVHMTCPNGHQFCYTCLAFWGSCNCPLIPEDEVRAILGE